MSLSRRDHVSKLPRNVSQGIIERDNIAKAQGKADVKSFSAFTGRLNSGQLATLERTTTPKMNTSEVAV